MGKKSDETSVVLTKNCDEKEKNMLKTCVMTQKEEAKQNENLIFCGEKQYGIKKNCDEKS